MNSIYILLTLLGLLTAGLIFLIIWEIKKRNDFSVIAHFITDDKSEERKTYKKITKKFDYKDETYFYDDKCSVTRHKHKHIYYLKGYSAPIDFSLSNDQIQLKYDSKTIDRLLKNNIIQKMLDDIDGVNKAQETRLIIYLGIVIIVILFGVHTMLNNTSTVCTIANNNQTINVIKNAVIQAIK